jgi:hypothetical protein
MLPVCLSVMAMVADPKEDGGRSETLDIHYRRRLTDRQFGSLKAAK